VDGSFGAFCKVLRPNGTVDPLYFGHFFRTPFYRRTVSGLAAGANINNLKNEHLDNLQIPLPPLPEQKRIAAILDAADALRAKRRESIEQLDLLIQATFLEMFGDSVKNPKGWESKRIEDFCKTQTGGTPSRSKASRYFGGSIPWVKSGELREQTIYDTEEHITPQALEESAAKMVPKGALMVALYGATVGRIARLGIDAATNQAICSIVPTATHVNPTFMFQALRTKVPEWLSRRVGGGQPNISNGVIKDTLIPLPPLALQTRFASIAESIEQQKTRLKTHLAELDTLFASLQSRAFNGELVA
jgi:type I restriction enzyme S subunit